MSGVKHENDQNIIINFVQKTIITYPQTINTVMPFQLFYIRIAAIRVFTKLCKCLRFRPSAIFL